VCHLRAMQLLPLPLGLCLGTLSEDRHVQPADRPLGQFPGRDAKVPRSPHHEVPVRHYSIDPLREEAEGKVLVCVAPFPSPTASLSAAAESAADRKSNGNSTRASGVSG